MATQLQTNETHEIPIDATGEYYFRVEGDNQFSLLLEGTDTASYSVDAGVDDDTPSTGNWFTDQATFTSRSSISEHYAAPERWVRVRITTAAATSGATADVAVVSG